MVAPRLISPRVAGRHNVRLDGMQDLLSRAEGKAVLDVGCNRGMVSYEFYLHRAAVLHGVDVYEEGLVAAREIFTDLRDCEFKFCNVNLHHGEAVMRGAFGDQQWDITVMLATYHKLKRKMPMEDLSKLIRYFGKQTKEYFAWRATSDKPVEDHQEMVNIDADLQPEGFRRIHTSYLSEELGGCAIWRRE